MSDKELHFHTIWSEEDQEFVGLCDEQPFMSYLDPNEEEALAGIKGLVDAVEKDEL